MAPPPVPPAGSLPMKVLNRMTGLHVAVYRLTRGRVGGSMGRAKVLLLHHVGRKSGQERVAPLLYAADGPDLVLVASAGGREAHPAWYHNLTAHPETRVEIGGETRRVRARRAEGEERARRWRIAAEPYPDYDVYATRTDREIPVIVLEPAG